MVRIESREFSGWSDLSPREQEVVRQAAEGSTDVQIGRTLGIGISTVNTYWVRIRAKVGPYTRTELVAMLIRKEMHERCLALELRIARLTFPSLASPSLPTEESGAEPARFLALAHVCEAVLVVEKSGTVVYANLEARTILRAERHELEGRPFWELTATDDGASCEPGVHRFFANETVRRIVLDEEKPYYARRQDGSLLRVTIAAEWYESPEGVMASVSLRAFSFQGHATRLIQAL